MRILLTGATGFLGQELGQFLTSKGHELVALIRRLPDNKSELPFPCTWIPADLEKNSQDKWIQFLQQTSVDAVIHLAGETINQRWSSSAKKRILESRTLTTERLLQSLKFAKKAPSVFLCASAIGFYGDRKDEILTEESSAGSGFLSEVCQQWESSALSFSKDPFFEHTRWVQARLGVILAKHGGAFPVMIKPFLLKVGAPLGFHNPWMSWLHLQDFLRATLFCLENQKIQGPINFVSPDPVQQNDFAKTLCRSLGTLCLPNVPSKVLEILLGERSQLILASQRVQPKVLKDHGFQWDHANSTNTLQELAKSFR